MTTAVGAIAPVIKRAGAPLETDWLDQLISLRVEGALGLMSRATLRFVDDGFALSASDTFELGTQISIAEPGAAGTLIDGTVTGINLEQSTRALPELVVVVDDAAYKLARATQVKTYLNSTYSQVLSQVCSRHGLTAQVGTTSLTFEYLLQAGSDLEFLNSIARRLGFAWWIEGANTLNVKPITPGNPAATLTLGEDLTEFGVRASALRPTELTVTCWDPDTQANNPASTSSLGGRSAPALLTDYLQPASKVSDATASVATVPALSLDEATSIANSLYNDITASAVVARGQADINGAVAPGVTVQISDAGPASGRYVISSVEHIYDHGGFVTRFVSGSPQPANLVDTLGTPPPDPGFVAPGLVVAIVTDNNDPDGAGRVKVRYTSVDGQIESPWARVVTTGGGKARGAVFQPEVQDEVLVGFEHGDTRRPVVVGGLFSKQNTLPTGQTYVTEGKVNYRRITSRKNHAIELADGEQPGQQHILLQLGATDGTYKLRLGADRFDIAVPDGKGLTIAAGTAKFDISASGDVTIQGNNVSIKANGQLQLEGTGGATLKGGPTANVQAAVVSVKGDSVGSVEAAGGPLTLKGQVVLIN